MIPELLGANVKKIGGKMLPTEVLIKKKSKQCSPVFPVNIHHLLFLCDLCLVEFYQQKHARKGGDPKTYATSIQLSPADGESYRLPLGNYNMLIQLSLSEIGICKYSFTARPFAT